MHNYTLFIADLHLQAADTQKAALFVEFLTTSALKADALYILGDLFEVWVGDDDNSEFNQHIKTALKQFTSTGIPLYLIRGNRDFLIGDKFVNETGCKVMPDPSKIDLYGAPTLLTHGDILCSKDSGYIRFRKYAHNPKYNRWFLMLPLKLRKSIAKLIRKKSIRNKLIKSSGKQGVATTTVLNLMQQHQVTQLIHGHMHKSATTDIASGKIISLGAWENSTTSILVYSQDHRCSVKS